MSKNDAINITNNSYPDGKSGLLYIFFRYVESKKLSEKRIIKEAEKQY